MAAKTMTLVDYLSELHEAASNALDNALFADDEDMRAISREWLITYLDVPAILHAGLSDPERSDRLASVLTTLNEIAKRGLEAQGISVGDAQVQVVNEDPGELTGLVLSSGGDA